MLNSRDLRTECSSPEQFDHVGPVGGRDVVKREIIFSGKSKVFSCDVHVLINLQGQEASEVSYWPLLLTLFAASSVGM